MGLQILKNKEGLVLFISFLLVFIIFGVSAYNLLTPKRGTWKGEIFETWITNKKTYIRGIGAVGMSFQGEYHLQEGVTYIIEYIKKGETREIISIEIVES